MATKTRTYKKVKQTEIFKVSDADLEIREYLEDCLGTEEDLDTPNKKRTWGEQVAHRRLVRWMSNRIDRMAEIGVGIRQTEFNEETIFPYSLENIGIFTPSQGNRFLEFYSKVSKKDRSWVSGLQVNQGLAALIALTPNYNRLPDWVRAGLMTAPSSAKIGGDRVGNVWRLIPCVKAWKHAPFSKGIAEKVGKMSGKSRALAAVAWNYRHAGIEYNAPRSEVERNFWEVLQALFSLTLLEQCEWAFKAMGSFWYRQKWEGFLSESLGVPYGAISLPKEVTIDSIKEAIASFATPSIACENLFGVSGKATAKAFAASGRKSWEWARAIAYGDADAVQKILALSDDCVEFQADAVEFLLSLPMQARLRLLASTTFKYRGEIHPISNDHVRDTGYLWSQFESEAKPDLGRVRCWFSAHETLASAYVETLPDEALPISDGWERINGLCSVDGSWEIEFPQRVATLKYYGQALRNCIGGYGNAIKSGRSIIFAIRERGILTHCVEVANGGVNQFCRSGNSDPDYMVKSAVIAALEQAELL